MLPLGFIIYPLIINLIDKSIYKKNIFNLFLYGFFYGLGFLLIFLSWIYEPFTIFDSTKPFALISIFLPLFISIFFGLSFLIFILVSKKYILIFITPLVILTTEILISNFIYSFPWITYSLILSNNLIGLQFIKYFGTITSGFLLILFFSLPVLIFSKDYIKSNYKFLSIILFPFFIIIIFNIFFKSFEDIKKFKEVDLSIHQIVKPLKNINKLIIEQDIINLINESNSDFIVFAENNYPYIIENFEEHQILNKIDKNKEVIIGSTTKINNNYFNSFLFLQKNTLKVFHKKILVPFGEFLPFRKYLNFMQIISGSVDFKTGDSERLLVSKENLKILPVICYEVMFDNIYNNINKNEIDVVINITNDLWFGNLIGPFQHLYIARIKSLIANNVLIRVSNNGISAVFDNDGKIIYSTELNKKTKSELNLKIKHNKNYYQYHNFLFYYVFLMIMFFTIFNFLKRNEK